MSELSVRELPLFPLPEVVLFPQEYLPLHIFETRYRVMLQSALKSDSRFGVVRWDPIAKKMADVGSIAGGTLRSYIERIERLEAEKTALTADIREIFSEAKGNGFDAKIMRQIVRLRRMDRQDRLEQEELLAIYQHAIGMDGPE